MLQRALSEYLTRVDRVQQLVLLRTGPGQAQLLGVAIDGARLPEVVGTLAGDDTILVITRDARRAKALVKRFEATPPGSQPRPGAPGPGRRRAPARRPGRNGDWRWH